MTYRDLDICYHLEKADEHLRDAESKLLIQDVQLAKMLRKVRENLKVIIDNYVGE